ncbi:MAG: ribbon-helix-helix protein, CopG family [Archaeoglobaceae archaeon]|nr:ribbon-helix-helix protein, CopG family [Archaeoglobaceae archaeon]
MIERLSVSLDKTTREKLEKLMKNSGKSASQIIREFIDLGYELLMLGVDSETIRIWVDYLAKRQHMILDVEHWRLIFSEIEKSKNDEFWSQMEEIGLSHAMQYKLKGLDTVERILRYVEKTNWYEMKVEREGIYTIVLNDLKIKRFVRTFLEKVFEGQKLRVEIKEGFGKLIIVTH